MADEKSVCENCGAEAEYHSDVILCPACEKQLVFDKKSYESGYRAAIEAAALLCEDKKLYSPADAIRKLGSTKEG